MRFEARLETEDPVDAERSFVVSFFLSDDSILIFEKAIPNSGMKGGKFLERMKLKLPDGSRYYRETDLYIGAHLALGGHPMVLTEADAYCYNYMAVHDGFPFSHVELVIEQLSELFKDRQEEVTKAVTEAARGSLFLRFTWNECDLRLLFTLLNGIFFFLFLQVQMVKFLPRSSVSSCYDLRMTA